MKTTTQSSKLDELRAKTDRQLVAFISSRLNEILQLCDQADRTEAEKVYQESRALLSLVYGLTSGERRRLEWKLLQVRELLSDLSSNAELNVQTACS
jgi:predicted exporter